MNKFLLLLCSICCLSLDATNHTVNTVGMSFSPSSLTINVGDTVTWHNTGGSHNINATQATFPNNPMGFGNTVGAGWTFQYIFTVAGTYNYQCDPHVPGMSGMIIVNALAQPLTYVPDDNFEAYLEANGMGDGISLNNSVFTSAIDTVSILYVSAKNISDLTGIEDFTALTDLDCSNNYVITSLDVSNNTALTDLLCFDNQLISLDVSGASDLTLLDCSNNQLTSLDVRNGNNTNMGFMSINNPNLLCIDVDDPVYSTANWTTVIDPWTSFSSNCFLALGCTDSLAINYDPNATIDDGSCTYLSNDLFISEYAEGSSYNKYIEIYNGTGSTVDLSDYDIWKIVNGGNWPEYSLSLTGTLANNEVYIICSSNSNVSPTILNAADTLWSSASWNGDDAVGLAKNGVLIDAVGNGVDPGVAWDVAGVVEATREHTLIRKCSVNQGDTNWIASAGVDSLTSQWLVYPQNYWLDINQHSSFCGCTDPLACNYDSLANTDDGSCAYDVIWQQAEIICNGDSLVVGSSIYYLSGTYTDSLSTIYGCDSIVYTNLIVDTATNFQQSLTLCEGDSLVIGSNIYYNAGNYSDTLTTIGGCDSIIFSNLGFYPQTPLIIQSSPDPAEICLGDTITLEASAGFSQYTWYDGTSQVGQSHILFDTPNDDQWYMVAAVDANGCVSREDINVYVDSCITGFNDINSANILLIYPIPASNQLTIDFMVKATSIRVYNMLGKLVIEKSIMEGQNRLQLNVKDWQTAIYNIQLYNEDGVIANKVLNVAR